MTREPNAALPLANGPVCMIHGHRMRLLAPETDIHLSAVLQKFGGLEPYLTEWITWLARPGDTVIDLGAHIGYYTLLLARRVGPVGRVLAFEPDPTNLAALAENVNVNGYRNIDIFPLAVSCISGPISLHKCVDNGGDHRLWGDDQSRTQVAVQAATLDDLFGPAHPRVSLIKMDIQGSELAALKGMSRFLAGQTHLAIVAEFWPRGILGADGDPVEFLVRLAEAGFRLHIIDEGGRRLIQGDPKWISGLIKPESEQFFNLVCLKG